ncbi:alanine racemase Alr [Gottschalkia purinilytica]|uniref:Alanine racemase n=1 Tax=Gottschalkia purinilytica TaxID=1503 RepID=A0A0L0WCH7_GOTPU|nr:alanine racemase [Gottschalkia purinilytica]KNF09184.1 alanine racemase Alr [Gottschalkia purinilytica]
MINDLQEIRPVWLEINIDNLIHNLEEIKRVVNKNSSIMAVVKADAYGHGATTIAHMLSDNGINKFAVATLSEAIELRESGIDDEILIMGYTPNSQLKYVIEYDIIQTIYNYDSAYILSNLANNINKIAKIHIKIDTGMNRLGFKPIEKNIYEIEKINKLSGLEIQGIFSHFAKSDEKDKSFSHEQFKIFENIIHELENRGVYIKIKHISNSGAIIDLPEYNFDIVRAGIMLYGLYPSQDVNKNIVNLKPVMSLKAKISNIKTVCEGTGVSYGQTYVTNKETKIATIPIGYADGFTRLLSGNHEVTINDKKAPVIGRICMDQCMVDVSFIDNIDIESEVTIFGYGKNITTVDDIAEKLGTINYEVMCMMNRRIPRVYIKDKKVVKILDYLL